MTERQDRTDRLVTGIPGLDMVLGGGLVRGAAYIINGAPGTGKTILANQIAFTQAGSSHKVLYISLLAEAHDRMLGYLRNLRFFDASVLPEFLYMMSAFSTLEDEGPEALLRLIRSEIDRHGAVLVVLDGLFMVEGSADDSRTFRRFVHDLQGVVAQAGCTALLLTTQSRLPTSTEHTMVDGWIELGDEQYDRRVERLLVVRKQRGGRDLRGAHVFRITDNGIELFPRIESVLAKPPEDSRSMARTTSGIAALDTLVGGGYPESSATLVLGPTGAGKTVFSLQFLSVCTAEMPGLFMGFHENPGQLYAKAKSLGIDLERKVGERAVQILWDPPGEIPPDEFAWRLLSAVERSGVRRVVIDGMTALRRRFVYPARVAVFVNALNNALRGANVTVFYTMEIPDLFGPETLLNDLSGMIDNLLLVHYARNDNFLSRRLRVLKIRDSDFDPFAREFEISSDGVHLAATAVRGGRGTLQ